MTIYQLIDDYISTRWWWCTKCMIINIHEIMVFVTNWNQYRK